MRQLRYAKLQYCSHCHYYIIANNYNFFINITREINDNRILFIFMVFRSQHSTVDETSVGKTTIEELVLPPTHIKGNKLSISSMRGATGHEVSDCPEKLNTNIEMYNSPY